MSLRTKTIIATSLAAAGTLAQAADPAPAPAPAEPKKSTWESSAGVGLTLTKGNSDTLTATANLMTAKKWSRNELSMGVDATYGEDSGEKNADTAHAFIQYNRLFTERFYGYGRIEGLYDDIADIDYRVPLSAGVGYYFIKNDKTLLSAEVGPGYVFEKVAGDEDDYATLRLAQKFEHKLTPTTRIWESAEVVPQVDNFENYVVTAEIGIETSISKNLNLRTYLQDIYRSEPAPGRDNNDLKLVAGVQYKF